MEVTHADHNFALTQTTKDRVPTLPFASIKDAVLGKKYLLSLVIAGDARTRTLNEHYRGKTYIPNVLSFPLDDNNGEIFLNLKQAKREYRAREESYEYFVALLVVHGMLHLKGMAHGSTMEKREKELLRKFHIRNTFPPTK
jgi:probable rRNA maturation factor